MSCEVDVQTLSEEFDLSTLDRAAYEAELMNFFKNYTQDSRNTDPDECILNSLNYFSSCLRDTNRVGYKYARMYTEAVFSAFEIFRYTNWDVIRSMLEFYVAVKLAEFDSVYEDEAYRRPSPPKLFPKNNIDYAEKSGHVKKISVDSLFYEFYTLADVKATKAMLRYGVRFVVEEYETQLDLSERLPFILTVTKLRDYRPACCQEQLMTLVNFHYPTIKDLRRMYFVSLAIHAVVLKKHGGEDIYDDFVKSLEMVFETIPDPIITIAECTRFFNVAQVCKEREFREFCDEIRQYVFFIGEHLQPRSLKHLCRCQVRERLLKSKALPHGIWKEGLPRELSNYVLLQEDEDKFYLDLGYKLK